LVSARLFDKAARRSGLDDDFRKHVRFLVRHLGRVEAYEPDWTDSAVRRLYRDCERHFGDLLRLASADITTKHASKRRAHRLRMQELAERAEAIAEADAALPALPKGLGSLVIERLALTPGPEVGQLMRKLEAAVEAGELPPRAEPEIYLSWLVEHRG
ncbi:MAG: metal-dependent phosphohydrolase, partial [Myxococcales bacterium]|nr:metal-dependent phosphohydrolase [Myxococcales bacterium]